LGNKSVADIDWVKKAIESKLSAQFINSVKDTVVIITENTDKKYCKDYYGCI
jgi:hypothetical protein